MQVELHSRKERKTVHFLILLIPIKLLLLILILQHLFGWPSSMDRAAELKLPNSWKTWTVVRAPLVKYQAPGKGNTGLELSPSFWNIYWFRFGFVL
jgi:hypothetical protein